MSEVRQTVGTDGSALPVLPPKRDARVLARLIRVMFYTPGFLALLLIKAGEPASSGITVELLMLSSAAAVVSFMIYQLAGYGTLHFVVSRSVNWAINLAILGLIIGVYIANHNNDFGVERIFATVLVTVMVCTVLYGVLKLKQMEADYTRRCPPSEAKPESA